MKMRVFVESCHGCLRAFNHHVMMNISVFLIRCNGLQGTAPEGSCAHTSLQLSLGPGRRAWQNITDRLPNFSVYAVLHRAAWEGLPMLLNMRNGSWVKTRPYLRKCTCCERRIVPCLAHPHPASKSLLACMADVRC